MRFDDECYVWKRFRGTAICDPASHKAVPRNRERVVPIVALTANAREFSHSGDPNMCSILERRPDSPTFFRWYAHLVCSSGPPQ